MVDYRSILRDVSLFVRPWRWSIFGYRFMPLVLLMAGCWVAVYGAFCHRISVTETHEEQILVPPPMQPMMPPAMPAFSTTDPFGQPTGPQPPMGGFGQPPDGMVPPEAMVPPVKFIQATKSVTTTSEEGELAVNRAVAFGAVFRDPQGQIIRKAGAEDGPAFCPS